MEKTFNLGYMPTRRTFFSKEDAGKFKKLIYEEIKKIVPENVTNF